MSKAFLNHKTEEKSIAISVRKYLTKCLISSWLDSEDIYGGLQLGSSIIDGIATNPYFLAFISYRYVRSGWCMRELKEAERHAMDNKVIIIPILLSTKDGLNLDELDQKQKNFLESILSQYKCIHYDQYDPEKSNKEIATAIGQHNKIRFDPVIQKIVQGKELQLIQFHITANDGTLPSNFLSAWNLNIENDFLASHDDKEKPLRAGKAVGFSGQGPNWLYAYLSVPFKNQCSVYIFNNRSNEYICIYDTKIPPQQLGKVLKET